MVRGIESILIGSEDPRHLAEFYRDKVGLRLAGEFQMGEENEEGFMLEFDDGPTLVILHHSEVQGTNENPSRIMINFEVDDCEEMCARLKEKDVPIVKDMYHVEEYGLIATFEDPDGNYFQCVQIRAADDLDEEEDEDDDEEEEESPNGVRDDDDTDDDEEN